MGEEKRQQNKEGLQKAGSNLCCHHPQKSPRLRFVPPEAHAMADMDTPLTAQQGHKCQIGKKWSLESHLEETTVSARSVLTADRLPFQRYIHVR